MVNHEVKYESIYLICGTYCLMLCIMTQFKKLNNNSNNNDNNNNTSNNNEHNDNNENNDDNNNNNNNNIYIYISYISV